MIGINRVLVVIPAHNEAARLNRLLDSLIVARAYLGSSVSSTCVVVADSCTDQTVEVARRYLDPRRDLVQGIWANSVGEARRRGTELGLAGCDDPGRVWVANTDADTVVPRDWLTTQVRLADEGYDAVAGTVTLLDDEDWCPTVAERFERAYRWPAGTQHPHIHGCNLGVRASTYVEVGGWSPVPSAEDGDLWRRLTPHARVLSSADNRVATSARLQGRAPDGFAGHITNLDVLTPVSGPAPSGLHSTADETNRPQLAEHGAQP